MMCLNFRMRLSSPPAARRPIPTARMRRGSNLVCMCDPEYKERSIRTSRYATGHSAVALLARRSAAFGSGNFSCYIEFSCHIELERSPRRESQLETDRPP